MKYSIFQLTIAFLFVAVAAVAQPNKKVAPALSKFLNTDFMLKYRDLRIGAESAAIGVQSKKDEMKASDLVRLRSAYDQTASRANNLLDNIKQDFLNQKKLKSIAEFPEMYSDGLRYKLQELSDYYTANFQQVLADAQVKNVDGSAVLILVIELISLSKGLTDYFTAVRREAKMYTDAYLQEHLVQPYRWRYWDEISGSTSPYEKFKETSTTDLTKPSPGEDLLDKQIQRITDKATTIDFNGNASDTDSGFNPQPENGTTQGTDFQYNDWSPTTDTTASDGQIKKDTVSARDTRPVQPKKTTKPVTPAKPGTPPAKTVKPAATGGIKPEDKSNQ